MWDWLQPTLSALSPVATGTVVWIAGREGRKSASREADLDRTAARSLHILERRTEAYQRVLQIGFDLQDDLRAAGNELIFGDAANISMKHQEKWPEARAICRTVGSLSIVSAFKEWHSNYTRAAEELSRAITTGIRTARGLPVNSGQEDHWDKFKKHMEAANQCFERLQDRMNAELGIDE
ncbi:MULTISPECIES: hypothetical protein [Amycolatopsis]|uniref:Uncharacterized protein n=1 Tax=Amycolatopsis bullii TaxID=941987 RepID=A0ABQ3K960_9PSEU|nr:hypothetical protein [Amycolatopsis bullii]GHG08863.1 hypothetical protein GCM10017567_27090 [Amycolatopsis bullii]